MEPRQLRANYKTNNGQTENQTRGLLHTQSGDTGVRSRGGHGQTPPTTPPSSGGALAGGSGAQTTGAALHLPVVAAAAPRKAGSGDLLSEG